MQFSKRAFISLFLFVVGCVALLSAQDADFTGTMLNVGQDGISQYIALSNHDSSDANVTVTFYEDDGTELGTYTTTLSQNQMDLVDLSAVSNTSNADASTVAQRRGTFSANLAGGFSPNLGTFSVAVTGISSLDNFKVASWISNSGSVFYVPVKASAASTETASYYQSTSDNQGEVSFSLNDGTTLSTKFMDAETGKELSGLDVYLITDKTIADNSDIVLFVVDPNGFYFPEIFYEGTVSAVKEKMSHMKKPGDASQEVLQHFLNAHIYNNEGGPAAISAKNVPSERMRNLLDKFGSYEGYTTLEELDFTVEDLIDLVIGDTVVSALLKPLGKTVSVVGMIDTVISIGGALATEYYYNTYKMQGFMDNDKFDIYSVTFGQGSSILYIIPQNPIPETVEDASFEGYVRVQGGTTSIAGASVTLKTGTNVYNETTDSIGHFSFSDVSPGYYTIFIQRQGYVNYSISPTLQLFPGESKNEIFYLTAMSAVDRLEVSTTNIDMQTGSSYVLYVFNRKAGGATINWATGSLPSWLKASKTSGFTDDKITLTRADSSEHSGTFTISSITTGESYQITVTMSAAAPQDTTAPTVTITSPSNGAPVTSSSLTVTGTASDASTISSVTVKGVSATDTGTNYSTWQANITLSEGPNTITVATSDEYNNANSNAASITVTYAPGSSQDITPPTVTIEYPSDGATITSSPITVRGTASDASGIKSVMLKINTVLGTTYSDSNYSNWHTLITLMAGQNTLTAIATDNYGNTNSTSITITYTPQGQDTYVVTITGSSSVNVGSTTTLSASTTKNSSVITEDYTWTIESGSSYITLTSSSNTATVKGLSEGDATITVTGETSEKSDTVTVKVTEESQDTYVVTITQGSSVPLDVGESRTLTATTTKNSSTITEDYTWTSSDTSVATVGSSSGVVKGIAAGDATITVTGETSGESDTIAVRVSASSGNDSPPVIGTITIDPTSCAPTDIVHVSAHITDSDDEGVLFPTLKVVAPNGETVYYDLNDSIPYGDDIYEVDFKPYLAADYQEVEGSYLIYIEVWDRDDIAAETDPVTKQGPSLTVTIE